MISSSMAIKAGVKAAAAHAGHRPASGKAAAPKFSPVTATQGLTTTGISLADLKARKQEQQRQQQRQQASSPTVVHPPAVVPPPARRPPDAQVQSTQPGSSSGWDAWMPTDWGSAASQSGPSMEDLIQPPPSFETVPRNPAELSACPPAAAPVRAADGAASEQDVLEQQIMDLLSEQTSAPAAALAPVPQLPTPPPVEEQPVASAPAQMDTTEPEDLDASITWDEITNLLRSMLSADSTEPQVQADEDGVFSQARDVANNLLADLGGQEPRAEPAEPQQPPAAATSVASDDTGQSASQSASPDSTEVPVQKSIPKAPMTPAKRKQAPAFRVVKEELRDDEPLPERTPDLPWARAAAVGEADLWSSMPDFLDAAGDEQMTTPSTPAEPAQPRKSLQLPSNANRVVKLKPAPSWLPSNASLPGKYAPHTPGAPHFRGVKREIETMGVKKELDAFRTSTGSASQLPLKDWEVRRETKRKDAFVRDARCKAICQIKHGLRQLDAQDKMPFKPQDWDKVFQPLLGDYLVFLKSRPDQFELVPVPGAPADVCILRNVAGNATVVAPDWGYLQKVKQEQFRAVKRESDRSNRRQGPYSQSGSRPWGVKAESREEAGDRETAGVATVKEENRTWARSNKWQRGAPIWVDEISKPLPPLRPVRVVSPSVIKPPSDAIATTPPKPDAASAPSSTTDEQTWAQPSSPCGEGGGQSDGESDGADLPFVIDALGDLPSTASAAAPPGVAEAEVSAAEAAASEVQKEEAQEDADDDDDLPFVIDVAGADSSAAATADASAGNSAAAGSEKKDDLDVWSLIANPPAEP